MSASWRRVCQWVAAAAVATGLTAAPAEATVGGTNGRIAFVATDQSLRIETIAADATGVSGPFATGRSPAWSPDGARIAYAGASQIFVMDGDGGHPTQLTHEPAASAASEPAWSPDGRRIVFTRATPASGSQLAVMNADGSGEAPLTPASAARDARANWSPDGTRIAFDSTRGGSQEVWVMHADGSSPTQLTTDPVNAFSAWPNWSPDSSRIAFESSRDTLSRNNFANGAEIYVMQADGSGPVRLTHDAASDERPSWAPDGTRIAFSHVTLAANGTLTGVQVFVMQADGSGQHLLVPSATEPDWQTTESDADGDGLPDDWETHGVDEDGDGRIDLDLPAMGADPRHKDVFAEIDAMPGDELGQAAIDAVVAAFAAAPVGDPDGATGIDLHVDNGPGSVMNPRTGERWGARSEQDAIAHAAMLGTDDGAGDYDWSAFDAVRAQSFSAAREPAFHYVIAADRFDAAGHSGISRGTPGGDLVIALGSICHPKLPSCTALAQAGTFMHELGHNLGLKHGGGDDQNTKPNYVSIMNYAFQFSGLPRADGTSTLDYSRFALAADETRLDERAGFGVSSSAPAASYLTLGPCPGASLWVLDGAVDFDCDGTTATAPVRADLNGNGALTALAGFDDWPHLVFKGAGIGLLGAPAGPATTPDDEPPLSELLRDQEIVGQALAAIRGGASAPTPSAPGAPAAPLARAAAPAPPLVLSSLRIRPASLRATKRGPAARVSYRLSGAGGVRFTVERCARRCSAVGSFVRHSRAGANGFQLRGRLPGRTLRPGRYRLVARPVQLDGRPGRAAHAGFRVLGAPTGPSSTNCVHLTSCPHSDAIDPPDAAHRRDRSR